MRSLVAHFLLAVETVHFDLIPLPHPSGVSPWHKSPPGRELVVRAMRQISRHPGIKISPKLRKGHNDKEDSCAFASVVAFVRVLLR